MPILLPEDKMYPLPKMVSVRQKLSREAIDDIEREVINRAVDAGLTGAIKKGQKIAIAVGSRGVAGIAEIVKALVVMVKESGAVPLIVSAMGSHGGGEAEGQREVLLNYGITEELMDSEINTENRVVLLGHIGSDIPVYTDEAALKVDMTILVNRVKPHTDFCGKIESGLCKMAVIGLGNHKGCSAIHKVGFSQFHEVIPRAAKLIFDKGNIAFGVAIVENSTKGIKAVEVIKAEDILTKEPALLDLAKENMSKILIPEMDILIVKEIGKNISGGGFDSNVIGKYGPKANSKELPKYDVLVINGLSKESEGNAIGIGCADFVTQKVIKDIDFISTYANVFAVGADYDTAFIPIALENEEEAIYAAIKKMDKKPEDCTIVRIKNTSQLETIEISENLMCYVQGNPDKFNII